jgi:hypothetical protein
MPQEKAARMRPIIGRIPDNPEGILLFWSRFLFPEFV